MLLRKFVLVSAASIICVGLSVLTYADAATSAKELALRAISNDSEPAIKELRERGEEGLKVLFETYESEIENFKNTGEKSEKWLRIAHALDTVAMQKDAYAAKLFWFTDLEKAEAEAEKSQKPILSLRLLGNLNEEFSCANSRFFRATLYPNARISEYLQKNYICIGNLFVRRRRLRSILATAG